MFYYTNKRKRNQKIILIAVAAVLAVALIVFIIIFSKTLFRESSPSPTATGTPAAGTSTPEPTPQKPLDETGLTVADRFGAPEGFKRVPVEKGSFGEFLRNYPLKPYGTIPKLNDGSDHEIVSTMGVLDQAIISGNQTSPRAVMFLYAEYLFEKGEYNSISFDFYTTPVFHFDYATWLTGQRVDVSVNPPVWNTPEGATPAEPTRENFERYIKFAMAYANTHSLKSQLNAVGFANLQVGDVMIDHKHAILILDICRNETTGEVRFICAEGKKEAVSEMYLLQDSVTQSVWMTLGEEGTFVYNGDEYNADSVRRF